jgi:hypothetical protein
MAMAHQVMWSSVCFTDDKGVDHYAHRGAEAPDWVDGQTLFYLTSAGALQVVDKPEETQRFRSAPEPVALPESSDDELVKPSADDTKAAWVEYASDMRNPDRITHDQANSMTKSALMERFK